MPPPNTQKNIPPTMLVAGPTASGKSSVAIALAQKYDGVIINADSMQVYRELRIITARPSVADEKLVPHAMYGQISGAERYSTGRWATDVRAQIDKAQAQGKTPIIVGGTGLYFRALIEGLAAIPAVDEEVSAYWRAQAAAMESPQLHSLLTDRDPIMAARLKEGDTQRITRALEVLEATGQSLSYWQQQKDQPVLTDAERQGLINIVIAPPREILYQRINSRFLQMVDSGGLEEMRNLQSLNIDPALPLMRALGVPELLTYLKGNCTKQEAIDKASMMSRRYAKRQMTWLRGNMSESATDSNNITWNWFLQQDKERLTQEILSLI